MLVTLKTIHKIKTHKQFHLEQEIFFFSILTNKSNGKAISGEGKELKQKLANRLPRCSWPSCWT